MKTRLLYISLIFALIPLLTTCKTPRVIKDKNSQKALKDMKELSKPSADLPAKMLAYVQASVHSKDPAKVEGKRRNLISSVANAIVLANQVTPYNGDTLYKDAILKYLNTLLAIQRNDYGRLVDLKKISEESYDAMEAYLLARKLSGEKLSQAFKELQVAESQFAKDYDITLVSSKSETGDKLDVVNEVFAYYNKIFLINFKSYKQELYLHNAMDLGDVSAIEQNRKTLFNYAKSGVSDLNDLPSFKGDDSLRKAAYDNLSFYFDEAGNKFPVLLDFILLKEQFQKMKQAFDNTPQNERTQADVDNFNAQVNKLNASGKRYNRIIAELNRKRNIQTDRWNKISDNFLTRHIPK